MSRYIDADAVLSRLPDDLPYKASVKRVLMQAPTTDVVEIVRCKDCKYITKDQIADEIIDRCVCFGGMIDIAPDGFCSYGERREV